MLVKILTHIIIFSLIVWTSNKSYGAERFLQKVKITPIGVDAARLLLQNHKVVTGTDTKNETLFEPVHNQSFKVVCDSRVLYIVSTTIEWQQGISSTCSTILIDEKKGVINTVNAVGPNEDLRPWKCDSTDALSFLDRYPDGSLKVIALHFAYAATSAFTVPVVLKLDLNKPSLEIDEKLTKRFDGKEVETIAAARAVLNRK